MGNSELIERLEDIIALLKDNDRETADAELYSLFDELEFVSDEYEDEDNYEEDEDYNEEDE